MKRLARSALPVCPSKNSNRRKEMNTLLKRFGSKRSLGMVALLGLASLAGTGPLACGQETFQGKLTLPVEARLGNTVLSPGEYQLRVALVGTTLSVNSIQDGLQTGSAQPESHGYPAGRLWKNDPLHPLGRSRLGSPDH
jgi:hypothetical protein